MTGFGKSTFEIENKKYSVEIRSLNSKFLDITLKIPVHIKNREIAIRNLVSKSLERGKIDFILNHEYNGSGNTFVINTAIIDNYIDQLTAIKNKFCLPDSNLLEVIMKMPDVLKIDENEISEDEWNLLESFIKNTLHELDNFRSEEGKTLEKDMRDRIKLIMDYAGSIKFLEESRIENIKSRLKHNITEFFSKNEYDANRFEQEIIYYLEKIDITEEMVRLVNHCNYFLETINKEQSQGKKLGFICQEIGREINTLGSKAYDIGIQKIVVNMKDELEKIKEQLLNVL